MKSAYEKTMPCPCKSGKPYEICCEPFHLGKNPDTALQLMRSRFAGYALCMPDYIMETTHPLGPQFFHDTNEWAQKISEFSRQTEFKDLEILEFREKDAFAVVVFVAHLVQDGKDVSFTETSNFEKVKGKWLYHTGEISPRGSFRVKQKTDKIF